ncbi:MAG: hypothetical protein AB3N06_11685 [Erythrobacter sp.]
MTGRTDVPQLAGWRRNLLRLAYAPLAFGLALVQLPMLAGLGPDRDLMDGVVTAMLSALCLLSFIGLVRPVRVLPVLLFEVVWKLLWLALVGIPAWLGGPMDAELSETFFACALVLPLMLLIPWDHVWRVISIRTAA